MRRITMKNGDQLDEVLARNLRFAQFMGDDRAAHASNCEFAQCVPGPDATVMDTEDFVNQVLKARVAVSGQDPRVLARWGI